MQMQMLEQLKRFNVDGLDVDEAVALLGFARQVEATYQQVVGESPEWLTEAKESLEKEVKHRVQDALEAKLKEVQSRREALKTADEKRRDLGAEEARILEKLGRAPKAAA